MEDSRARPKDEWWPLIVGFVLAVPIILAFAHGLARAAARHEVRPILVLVLVITVCVPGVVIGATLATESIRDGLRRWARSSPGRRDPLSSPHLDDSPDARTGDGGVRDPMRSLSDGEYCAGRGLSLMQRFRRPIAKPERRS